MGDGLMKSLWVFNFSLNEIRDCSTALSTMVLDFIKDFQVSRGDTDSYCGPWDRGSLLR